MRWRRWASTRSTCSKASVAEPAVASGRALRGLHLLCLLLVTHGSLYPWSFAWPARGVAGAWDDLLADTTLWSGLGDVVGNVVLFVPLGTLAWLDLRRAVPRSAVRFALLMGLGILFAFVLQVLQFFVPARVPQLSDVAWNALGLVLGVGAVPLLGSLGARVLPVRDGLAAALVLVGFWLVGEWWPLVPTIDWQHVKDALKPLVRDVRWSGPGFAEAVLTMLAVSRLLRGLRSAGIGLVLLAFAALAGKLFIVGQSVSLGRASGLVVGLLLARPLARLDAGRTARWLCVAVIVWLCVDGLRPFELAETPNTFHWLPFTGVLEGSLSANSLALLQMAFWVGVAMLMGRELGARLGALAAALSLLMLLIEGIQVFLPGRSADTTVVLVPCVWWLVLRAWSSDSATEEVTRSARSRSSAP